MFISKKDLLNETGISYGQLYRWKREGLIPESWFIKQPVFTGQETFFPRDKILARIRAINVLKDRYSLEELAKILSPEISERYFTFDDLRVIEEIDKGLITLFFKVFSKESFSYIEVLILISICGFKKDHGLSVKDVETLLEGLKGSASGLKQTDYLITLYELDSLLFTALWPEQAEVFVDKRARLIGSARLNDVSSRMKVKYKKRFNFTFDDDRLEDGGESGLSLIAERGV